MWEQRVGLGSNLSKCLAKCNVLYFALESSNIQEKISALSYVWLLQPPAFIVSLVLTHFVLSFSPPLCLALQKTNETLLRLTRMHNYVREQYMLSRMRWYLMNYGTKLKQLLLKLALSTISHEPITVVDTGAMQELTLKMLVTMKLTTHLLITVWQSLLSRLISIFIGNKPLPNTASSITTETVEAIADFCGPNMQNKSNV